MSDHRGVRTTADKAERAAEPISLPSPYGGHRFSSTPRVKLVFFIFLCVLVGIGYRQYAKHRPAKAPTASSSTKRLAAPTPPLTEAESTADAPSGMAFEQAGWSPVSAEAAESFSYVGGDVHCNVAWRDAVRNLPAGARIEQSRVGGYQGICTWYAMRIVDRDGLVNAQFSRPGPRASAR